MNTKGCTNLAFAAVEHAVMPFSVKKDTSRYQILLNYDRRFKFLTGKLVKIVCDVLEYDYEKFLTGCLEKLEKEKENALLKVR